MIPTLVKGYAQIVTKGNSMDFDRPTQKKGLDNPKLVNLKELLGQELYK